MNGPLFLKMGWLIMTGRFVETPPVSAPPPPPEFPTEIATGDRFPPGAVALVLNTPTGITESGRAGFSEPGDFYTCSIGLLRECGPSTFVLDVNPAPGTSGAFIRHPKVFYYPDFGPVVFVWPGISGPGASPSATPGQRSQLVLAGTSLLDLSTAVAPPGKLLPEPPIVEPEADPFLEILLTPKSYRTGNPVTFAPPGDTLVGGVDPEENMPEPGTSVLAVLAAFILGTGRRRPPAAAAFP